MTQAVREELDKRTSNNGGKAMILCTDGRLKGIAPHLPARLNGLTIETSDGSYYAIVHERMPELDGLYWRVHVKRFKGRSVDLVLPVEGYCLTDLFEETGRQLEKLTPELVA